MIKRVKILDANYSGLETRFPQGLELDTDSPIVLLVGPNNVGKTAFLRMLATSIDFGRYFKSQGISHFWDYSADGTEKSVSRIVDDLKKAKEIEDGWFYFGFEGYYKRAFNKLCQHKGIKYANQVRKFDNSSPKFVGYNATFKVISQEGKNQILELEDLLKEDTDENVWGFVKPTIVGGGDVFFQHFDLPKDDRTVHEQNVGLRRYVHFVNMDDYHFGELKPSPGYNLYRKLEELFEEQIRGFFEERKTPTWEREDYSMDGRIKKVFNMGEGRPMDDVPENAQLCVIMDEPTIFLDAVNKFRFQRKMIGMMEQYPGRLQFFIASNDYALIRGLEGSCMYVNMYEQPVVSSRTFDVKKYLSKL